jgi:hypothetical protein
MSNHNPFKPPETDSTKNPRLPDVPGSPLKAVLSGLAVDIGGSAVLGIVLDQVYGLTLRGRGLAGGELEDAMQHIPPTSAFGVLGILLGALMSVAGGYVCARIVLRDEYRVGGAMAAVSALLGLAFSSSEDPSALTALLILCTVACNMLGVKYGSEQNRRLEALAAPPTDTPAA